MVPGSHPLITDGMIWLQLQMAMTTVVGGGASSRRNSSVNGHLRMLAIGFRWLSLVADGTPANGTIADGSYHLWRLSLTDAAADGYGVSYSRLVP